MGKGNTKTDIKLRQVTDNIHETIYLSGLESEFISTPFFYRLHDIYQSSSVYTAFPTNRTKRYEHSLGTMELAGEMLFSAVSNADPSTKKLLFDRLRKYYQDIFELSITKGVRKWPAYLQACKSSVDRLFGMVRTRQMGKAEVEKKFLKTVPIAVSQGLFSDTALDHFQCYQFDLDSADSAIQGDEGFFLYRCLLQAIRLVALFHDVGHPPYSHVIEKVLSDLYKESLAEDCDWDPERRSDLRDCLEQFAQNDSNAASDSLYKCDMLYSEEPMKSDAIHECIGLYLFQLAINDVIPQVINNIAESKTSITPTKAESKLTTDGPTESDYRQVLAFYYIFVAELAMAIMVEKDLFFKSMHKIVDGILDADRFDYITRDSYNSGVDWGQIPYKRVINSAKLFTITQYGDTNYSLDECPFVIGYPAKVQNDIEDLLITRYKLYSRINFQHRCVRSAVALQSSVKLLALDYLKNSSNSSYNPISPNIDTLWRVLSNAGNETIALLRWNDSWLISVLQEALVNLKLKSYDVTLSMSEEKQDLLGSLEEFLLNKKRFRTVIKRNADSVFFIKEVFDLADISIDRIKAIRDKETDILLGYSKESSTESDDSDILRNPAENALEAIKRLDSLEDVYSSGDIEELQQSLPEEESDIAATIENALKVLKEAGEIEDFCVYVNTSRKRTGLPTHDNALNEIYLYNRNTEVPVIYEDEPILDKQISALSKSMPWIYIYYVPPKDTKETDSYVMETCAKAVSKGLKERFNELFGNVERREKI